jgi:hypothetical protein
MNATTIRSRWDVIGISASFLCLIHCLGLPYLLMALPALGLTLPDSEMTHRLLAAGVVIPAAFGALRGYRIRYCMAPFLLIGIGIALIAFAAFVAHAMLGEAWETPLTVSGSLSLVVGHLLNRRILRRRSACCTGEACKAMT